LDPKQTLNHLDIFESLRDKNRPHAQLGWAELAPNSGRLAPTFAREPDWGLTWCSLGTFGRKLVLAREPPSKPKNVGNQRKNANFERVGVILARTALARPSSHVGLKVGPKVIQMDPKFTP